MKTLIIDNYDSFTYNLVHLVAELNQEEPIIVRNDEVDWEELHEWRIDNIVISPGPGRPDRREDFGVSKDAILKADVPILGVCLGHQGIGTLAGGKLLHSCVPMHGRTSDVFHISRDLFAGVPSPFKVARYHSLVIGLPLPESLLMTAWTADQTVMAVAHRHRLQWGVQFHPESIITEHGRLLMRNFRDLTRRSLTRCQVAIRNPKRWNAVSAPSHVCPVKRRCFWAEIPEAVDTEMTFRTMFANSQTAFWLDSSLVESGRGRWSYFGDTAGPNAAVVEYAYPGKSLSITDGCGTRVLSKSVFDYFTEELTQSSRNGENVPPCPFTGGYIGWLGYEMRHECGAPTRQKGSVPDALFIKVDRFVAVDHLERRTFIVAIDTAEEATRARQWIVDTAACLYHRRQMCNGVDIRLDRPLRFALHRNRKNYLTDIDRSLQWIRDGETYQICLTNELRCHARPDPLHLYQVMRRINPAPFAAYLKWPGGAVLSASPERFLSLDNRGNVETKPIKGTIHRSDDGETDRRLAQELRYSEKDRAENVMIVDLLRNDLSRVCETGSVVVPKLFDIETYATVHQMVSTVRGVLRSDRNAINLIKATFPGGSMTGAPKLRTLQFIDSLEHRARGVYSGALGWIGNDGAMDLSIVIRTIVYVHDCLTLGVGGGIVALSDPDREFAETLLKARAPIKAIVLACAGNFHERNYQLDGLED